MSLNIIIYTFCDNASTLYAEWIPTQSSQRFRWFTLLPPSCHSCCTRNIDFIKILYAPKLHSNLKNVICSRRSTKSRIWRKKNEDFREHNNILYFYLVTQRVDYTTLAAVSKNQKQISDRIWTNINDNIIMYGQSERGTTYWICNQVYGGTCINEYLSYNGRNNKVPAQKYIDLFPMDFDLSVTFFHISETNSYSFPLYTTTEGVNNLSLNSNK